MRERSLTLLENLFLHVSHLKGLVCCHLVHNKKYDACCMVMLSQIWCYIPMLLLPLIVNMVYSKFLREHRIIKFLSKNLAAFLHFITPITVNLFQTIVGNMERLDHGHLHPKPDVPRLTCLGRESNPGLPSGRRALKELFEQCVIGT